MTMKTEFERISEIMYTLLEHQPVIDVPYEKINDIAVALVKEGYGKISGYESEIERLKAENEHRKKQYDNQLAENTRLHIEYDKAFERLKAQEREIERLRTTLGQCNTELNSALESLKSQCREIGELKAGTKQAKIDVLNDVKKYLHTEDFDTPDERWKPESEFCAIIDELIKEVQNGEDKG